MRNRLLAIFATLLFSSEACVDWAGDLPVASASAVYPLDTYSRSVLPGTKLACENGELELTPYRGEHVRYQKPVRVHPAFKAQLAAFEAIVAELAQLHFGRVPRAIVHFGAYACRPMRNHAHWVSEHAFGNAIDVAGFDFAALPRKHPSFTSLPKTLRKSFSVRVDKDWRGAGEGDAKRAFLHALAERLIARPDVFRALVGPDHPGHDNHLHLAHPPYRMVKLGDVERWWFW
jgi:hypothetical protein